ncbi:MAG: hypothetical protein A2015_13270 [Spirochaetes bacterium GWF1_31_7]|nr:MAG: hypothetical protein A2Y30_08835 [Spirochaetes bacterium GWE1_32_154]OHD47117.1 MAG: hypothetical protein A2Y29_05935 [Spirochaetes bacterium GWE2_31_10]OHD50687.1 MAG: hypothetical protein A2015_13270 [Spirochaetes bacterium GWF1_31_7]HBD96382.1 hypothetical protein [Spirochaetia bacterium]
MNDLVKILYVDDEEVILSNVKEFFDGIYDIITMQSSVDALKILETEKFDIIMSDFKMPEITGFDLLTKAKELKAYTYGILLTAYADKSLLEQMINNNLVNKIVEKPYKLKDLKIYLDEAVKYINTKKEESEKISSIKHSFEILKSELSEEIIGAETTLKDVYKKIATVSKHDVNVLISGETGTGKELVAKTIHYLSSRRDGPFIKINSTAIPETLFESELFGYKKGAFSNATQDKAGKVELAHKGTLFLDEIGDMDLSVQAKLLRVLQEKEVERLGSNKVVKVDFRLIVAANKNLHERIENKLFREDLFYRMNEFPISLPPLRERVDDIEALIKYFLIKSCVELNIKPMEIAKETFDKLRAYNWPGNVRELKNAVKRVAIAFSEERIINPDCFDFLFIRNSFNVTSIDGAVKILKDAVLNRELELTDVEDKIVEMILKDCNNSVSDAVDKTGISKNRFYKVK